MRLPRPPASRMNTHNSKWHSTKTVNFKHPKGLRSKHGVGVSSSTRLQPIRSDLLMLLKGTRTPHILSCSVEFSMQLNKAVGFQTASFPSFCDVDVMITVHNKKNISSTVKGFWSMETSYIYQHIYHCSLFTVHCSNTFSNKKCFATGHYS